MSGFVQSSSIRIKALGLIYKNQDHILLTEDYDTVKKDKYYRPPGGTVEFGEYAIDTLVREFREELDAELVYIELASVFENIFECDGYPGHEIVFVFTCKFADPWFYEQDEMTLVESNLRPGKASWMSVAQGIANQYRLVPEKLVDYLQSIHCKPTTE